MGGDPNLAVSRAIARDGLDEEAIRKRIASQLSNEERAARADVVIDNSGNEETLISRLNAELTRITG